MRGARLYWQSGHLWPPNYPTTLGHLNNDVEEDEDGDGDGDGGEADGLRMIMMSEDDCDDHLYTPFGEKILIMLFTWAKKDYCNTRYVFLMSFEMIETVFACYCQNSKFFQLWY